LHEYEKIEDSMQSQPNVDYGRKWFVMAAVGMGIFLGTIDGSIINVALPTLSRNLETEFAVVQWVSLAYLLTMATLMLSMGRLGDMIGKKRVYASGFVIFTLGSLLCGIAPSIYLLIVFRVLQAVGAAMMTLGMAIITENFPPSERGKALGIAGSLVSIGIILGPVVGGLILSAVSWRWIFYVNLPIGIIGTWMVLRLVPETAQTRRESFDFMGAIALFFTMASLLMGLTIGQNAGFTAPVPLILFGVGLLSLIAFIWIEKTSSHPMIDLAIFRNRLFDINLVTGMITFITISGTIILMPFYMEGVLGFPTNQVGLIMASVPISMGIIAPLSGSLSDRVGSRLITVIGLFILVIANLGLATISTETSAWMLVLLYLPVGLGMGIFQSPNNSVILGSVPQAQLGVASGLLATNRTLGQTTGIAVLGALWAASVTRYLGFTPEVGATSAPPAIQVEALQVVFYFSAGLLFMGLLLAIWGLLQERRGISNQRKTVASE
jgi:EmrB/QacA subfamily drug resistance transporter